VEKRLVVEYQISPLLSITNHKSKSTSPPPSTHLPRIVLTQHLHPHNKQPALLSSPLQAIPSSHPSHRRKSYKTTLKAESAQLSSERASYPLPRANRCTVYLTAFFFFFFLKSYYSTANDRWGLLWLSLLEVRGGEVSAAIRRCWHSQDSKMFF